MDILVIIIIFVLLVVIVIIVFMVIIVIIVIIFFRMFEARHVRAKQGGWVSKEEREREGAGNSAGFYDADDADADDADEGKLYHDVDILASFQNFTF